MAAEFLAAIMIVATGTAFSGASTHFYQWLVGEQARLRFDGDNIFVTMGHVFMSFVCGPFIMLNMGWRRDSAGGMHLSQAFLSAFIAFGWSFIIGAFVLAFYIGVVGL